MRKKLQSAIDHLNSVMDDHAEWEGLSEKLADAKARLAATAKEHKEVSAKLADDHKLLDERQQEARKKHEVEMYAATQELKVLTDQVASRKKELAEVSAHVKAKREEHDQILASLQALRTKLA